MGYLSYKMKLPVVSICFNNVIYMLTFLQTGFRGPSFKAASCKISKQLPVCL